MKKRFSIGKIFIAIGIIHLFRKMKTSFTFGGDQNNAWFIILISVIFITVGLFLELKYKKALKK